MEFKHVVIVLQDAEEKALAASLFGYIVRKYNTSLYNLFSFVAKDVYQNFRLVGGKVEVERFDLAALNEAVQTQVYHVDQALFRALCIAQKTDLNSYVLLVCRTVQATNLLIMASYLAYSLNIAVSCINLSSDSAVCRTLKEITIITGGGYMEYDGGNQDALYFVLENKMRSGMVQEDYYLIKCAKCQQEKVVGTLCSKCGRISCDQCAVVGRCSSCGSLWK